MSSTHSPTARWIGYVWALGLIAAAYAIHLGLESVFGDHDPLLLLALAVTLTAHRCGLGPGVVATSLGVIVASAARGGADAANAVHGPELVAFLLVGLTTSLLCEALLQARARREADTARIRASEHQVRLVTDSLPALIAYVDRERRFRFHNAAYERSLGLEGHELAGRPMVEVLGEPAYRVVEPYVDRALAGESVRFEARIPFRPDRVRHVDVEYVPDRGEDGEVRGFFALINDVDDRVRALAAQRESEQRFSLFMENLPGAAWIKDRAGRYVYVNSTAVATFRKPFEQVLGHVDEELFPSSIAERFRENDRLALERGAVQVLEQIPAERGLRYWVVSKFPILGRDGTPLYVAGIAIDVTERKRAEEALHASERQFATLVEHSPDVIFRLDRELRHLFVNSAVELVTGVPRARFLGRTGRELGLPPRVCDRLESCCREVLASGEPRSVEYEDRGMHFRSRVVPELDEQGRVRSLLGITEDVTESRRAEAERRELLEKERSARREAERANRLKDEFVATLSHELRTPLNAILGWAQLLREDQGVDSLAQAIEVIERNARLQSQMVSDLLDMSRILSGKVRLELRTVDLATLVAEAVDSIRPSAEEKRLRISLELGGAALVRCDPGRLHQVLWNLLSNAVKFTDAGGAIEVGLARSASSARVVVRDSGEGIASEFLPHLFERFRQADGSTTRRHGGLGLGLSIARQLVDLHGGAISAQSDGLGRGSTFAVELPLAEPAAPEPSEADAGPCGDGSVSLEPGRLAGLRVLVVDDQPDARELCRRLLARCGAEVATAASAAEARARLAQRRPNVLVSDLGMPVEDGYDLIRSLRAGERASDHLPAVALSALVRREDRDRAFAAGFDAYLEKPLDPGALVRSVAELARAPRAAG